MAQPTTVNPQITDAVAQASVFSVAQSSAVAVGLARVQFAHAISLSMHAATHAQQAARLAEQASVITAVTRLLRPIANARPEASN